MMERKESYPGRPLELTLRQNEDFIFDDEIMDVMRTKLQEHNIPLDNIVFSGYDANNSGERTELFACDTHEYQELQKLPSSTGGTPLDYAMDARESGRPAIGVYDKAMLDQQQLSYHYTAKPGSTIEDAKVAVFLIDSTS